MGSRTAEKRKAEPAEGVLDGLVMRHEGTCFWVRVGDRELPCALRGRIRKEAGRVSSAVVVGDRVQVVELPDGTGVVEAVLPRRSELSRPGFGGLPHIVAANLDQLVIVQAAVQPAFKRRLVERFLAVARRGRMEPLVNKCDLVPEATIRSWVAPLDDARVRVLLTSASTGAGVEELRELLRGRASAMAGQSGVGKSSLTNAVCPELGARVSEVSSALNKGRHTTTSSCLYALPDGGYLADTPGIRELALFEDSEESVEESFPEIAETAAGCRFRDCSHLREPACAVRAAVERGAIHPDRFHSYQRMRGN
jgi:ribosome biogenesis GTPase